MVALLLSKKRPTNNPTFLKIFLARLNPAGALRQSARALELSIALVHEERRDRALGAPGRDYHRQLRRVLIIRRIQCRLLAQKQTSRRQFCMSLNDPTRT